INGLTVTNIGDSSLSGRALTSVTIPNGVTSIGYYAFGSNQLTSLTIPSSVTSIASGAFKGNNIAAVSVLGTLNSLGSDVLTDNSIESITYGGVTYSTSQPMQPVPAGCFEHNDSTLTTYLYKDLKSVVSSGVMCAATDITLPQNLDGAVITAIGDSALTNKHLTSVIIPDGVTSIGDNAFNYNQLTSITIPSSMTSIGDSTFQSNKLTSVTIPDGVTSIGDYAFNDNQLTSITIPSSMTSIGDSTFQSNKLTSVIIPDGVTSIGNATFQSNKLTSLTIPSSVTSIGNGTFQSNSIGSIVIPSAVMNIGSGAFSSNDITAISLLGTPSSMSSDAFSYNTVTSVTYNGTTYSSSQPAQPACFQHDNDMLTEYRYLDLTLLISDGIICAATFIDIPQSLDGIPITKIGDAAFTSKQLSSIVIPDGVTSIGSEAFSYNRLTSLTIPNSVTSIGDFAVSSNRLSSLTIPNSVTTIGSGAFFANSIANLIVPDSVTSVGDFAFESNQLTSLTLGCGVDTIGQEQYAINKLKEVIIPGCIKTVDPTAFFGQNPWGGIIDQGYDPAHYLYSYDASVLQLVHDNLWYVQLHTSDPSNPNHITDGIVDEAWYTGDLNNDGDLTDSIGGHLVNPATITVHYVDESGEHLSADIQATGHLNGGVGLTDYLVKNVPTPGFSDAGFPTAQEQAALEISLSQYYRLGQSVSLAAPSIAGYTLLNPTSPHSARLTSTANDMSFVYRVATTDTPTPGSTPATPVENSAPTNVPVPKAPQLPSSPATNGVNIDPAPTPATNSPLSRVDFSAPSGSIDNPTKQSAPQGLATLMAKSSLQTDTSKSCHQIESAQLLPARSFKTPDTRYMNLGGMAFALNCEVSGGDAAVTITLGGVIPDLTRVKVYKRTTSGHDADITRLVRLANQGYGADSRTTISYALQDGQALDDDGVSNGRISDPIYVAVLNETVVKPIAKQPAQSNTTLLIGAAIAAVGLTSTVIIRSKHLRR
ncbi:MAG: leucine-rich repeat protein, partial [Candidatus Saccharimonadales bacterium]